MKYGVIMSELDIEKIVREYVDKTIHLSLATVKGDTPWVCEVHFAYDKHLNIYFRSLKSRRHSKDIADNPKVAGSIIDKYGLGDPAVGVFFEGAATLLEVGDEQNIAAECLGGQLKIEEDIVAEATEETGHQFYKITIANWYVFGRFGELSGRKYKLKWNGSRG